MQNSTVILILTVFLLGSCAPKRKPAKIPPRGRPPVSIPSSTEALTPEREASNALVEEGLQMVDRGMYDRASSLFQEAVTVDPTNGAGYYHLAFVKARTGDYGEAAGLLDKAAQLLSGDPDWESKLEGLRNELGESR